MASATTSVICGVNCPLHAFVSFAIDFPSNNTEPFNENNAYLILTVVSAMTCL